MEKLAILYIGNNSNINNNIAILLLENTGKVNFAQFGTFSVHVKKVVLDSRSEG